MKIKNIILLIWLFIGVPALAYAVFADKEVSRNNTFSATTLETILTPELTPPVELSIQYETPYPSTSFILQDIGQLQTKNTLSIDEISNPIFATLIDVTVTLDDTIVIYTGPLSSLSSSEYLIQNTTQSNKLGFVFSITEDNYNASPEETVTLKIKNHAWQSDMTIGSGFFDNESMEIVINNPLEIVEDE